jgi:hypothetical protein
MFFVDLCIAAEFVRLWMIPLGLITFDIPSVGGNMFSQNVAEEVTISMTMRDGIFLNGTELYMHLTQSFSISGMCSLFDATFKFTFASIRLARIGSNSLSV